MKTPQFWHKRTLISYLLLPLSAVYLIGHYLNILRKESYKINKPVICIGNLVAGGAGKTPVAIALGKILKELNIDFAYLSSGYGGKIRNFTLVKPELHLSSDVGDEPLILSETSSTFISENRVIGARRIELMPEKKLIVLDDGLQNPSIKKDLPILVVDGNYGFGNGFIIPAGALREPICMGAKKADLIVIIGEDKHDISTKFSDKKIIKAKMNFVNYDQFIGQKVVAFCGIGRPEKFFDNLEKNNIHILEKHSFADHYQYLREEIENMLKIAKKNNAKLITTKKDWIRLAPEYQKQISYLDIAIEFEDKNVLKEEILQLINR